jgi:hypothetical protein
MAEKGMIVDAIARSVKKARGKDEKEAAKKRAAEEKEVYVQCLRRVHCAASGVYQEGQVYRTLAIFANHFNEKYKKKPVFKVLADEKAAKAAANDHAEKVEKAREAERKRLEDEARKRRERSTRMATAPNNR